MDRLSAQVAGFLRIETPRCPFHVAALMLLSPPEGASRTFLRQLARDCGRLNEILPAFNRQLSQPEDPSAAAWVEATHYRPEDHVLHYALPQPGRMQDLLQLVTRVHERPLDRNRPLWELHIIEGLPGGRFALYCKTHHALVDGIGAMRMIQSLFSTDPAARIDFRRVRRDRRRQHSHHSLFEQLGRVASSTWQQYRALPQLSRLLMHMGKDVLTGNTEAMRLPFTAPRSVFNTELEARRSLTICDLPLRTVRRIAHQSGGTINDVLLAICGGALRRYLAEQNALPKGSLIVGMPVSLKAQGEGEGNRLSYILSPFFTTEADDYTRLQRVIRTTRTAKRAMAAISVTAAEDFYALLMLPAVLLTVTGNAERVRPAINAIFSNVPGAKTPLYLNGAHLDALYPLSIITHGMGLNITVVSHAGKLCVGIASCPERQAGIEALPKHMLASYHALRRQMAGQ